MRDRVTYEYAVIRLVPKVEREEFMNVGVILFSKRKKYLGIKYVVDEQRVSAFAKEVDVSMIQSYLEAWESICNGSPEGGKIGELEMSLRFRWLVASRSTIIQSSPVHPGICNDAESILKDLFEKYVL